MDAIAYKLRTKSKIVPLLILCLNAFCGFPFRLYRHLVRARTVPVEPRKILVIRADRIGDMILAMPMFQQLKERYPDAAVTCLSSSLSSQLVESNPFIDEVLSYDPPWFDRKKGQKILGDYIRIRKRIRAERFDMAIDLRGNYKNFFFLMLLTGIRRRVSFEACFGAFMLTDEVRFEPGKHETEYFMDIVTALGGRGVENPRPLLVLSEKEDAFADDFLRSNKIGPENKVIAIHPGAGQKRIYKRWPEEYYIELGRALVEKHEARLIITGSEVETDLAMRIANAIGGNAVSAAGRIARLKDLAAVLRRCLVCIGSSTGVIHLAAAVGTPVVVLCGPEDPARWRPLSDTATLIVKEVPCRPCREESCSYDGKCLRSISPVEAFSAVDAYVK